MKVFSIGDSITQGFMSGAAARTDLSYPTLVAKAMGLVPGNTAAASFRIPSWAMDGLPINLEALARLLRKKIGGNIDIWDWPRLADVIRGYMDDVEDYYERGDGRPDIKFGELDYFHNIGVQGMDVADAWLVTPKLCYEQIRIQEARDKSADGLFAFPSAAFYRTALNVLNPQRDPTRNDWNTLSWLEHHATSEGVENTLLWLGANNVLGTVTKLEVIATRGPGSNYDRTMSRSERDSFNLWAPSDFSDDYHVLLGKVDAIMRTNADKNWRVFIATVPPVSVAPLAKGVGDEILVDDPFGVIAGKAKYFKYYTYFLFDEETAQNSRMKLGFSEIYQIDTYIAQYNKAITDMAAVYNAQHGSERYVVVDVCKMLLEAAYKRNNNQPTYDWPPEVKNRFPMVDTRFHHAEKGDRQVEQGGLFGLDGIHPSAIGQGLIAHEFLKSINRSRTAAYALDWNSIYASDSLYQHPIELMGSIRRKAEDISKFLIWAVKLKGKGSARNL